METIVIIGIAIVVFIALREVFCWYYKINETIKLQKEQIRLLLKIAGEAKQ